MTTGKNWCICIDRGRENERRREYKKACQTCSLPATFSSLSFYYYFPRFYFKLSPLFIHNRRHTFHCSRINYTIHFSCFLSRSLYSSSASYLYVSSHIHTDSLCSWWIRYTYIQLVQYVLKSTPRLTFAIWLLNHSVYDERV